MHLNSGLLAALQLSAASLLPLGSPVEGREVAVERPFCTTSALPLDDLLRGEVSEVTCFATRDLAEAHAGLGATPEPGEGGRGHRSAHSWARHWDNNGWGAWLLVTGGATCDGSGLSFAYDDPWNDRVTSTQPLHCGTVKHYQHSDRSGLVESVQGGLTMLGALMDNQTSATAYLP